MHPTVYVQMPGGNPTLYVYYSVFALTLPRGLFLLQYLLNTLQKDYITRYPLDKFVKCMKNF